MNENGTIICIESPRGSRRAATAVALARVFPADIFLCGRALGLLEKPGGEGEPMEGFCGTVYAERGALESFSSRRPGGETPAGVLPLEWGKFIDMISGGTRPIGFF